MIEKEFNNEDLSEIYRLRISAWGTRMDLKAIFPNGQWSDDFDADALHFGINREGAIVASARLNMASDIQALPYGKEIAKYAKEYEYAQPFFMLSRLVVIPSARNNGYARLLDKARLQAVAEHGAGTAFLVTSSRFRIEKLLRLGFRQASDIEAFDTFPGGKSTLFVMKHDEICV